MTKIVFIGAGSRVFTRNLTRDILTFPAMADANLVLVDTHAERLEIARQAVETIIQRGHYPAKVQTSTDRATALKDGKWPVISETKVSTGLSESALTCCS